jgi:hypothetical protein
MPLVVAGKSYGRGLRPDTQDAEALSTMLAHIGTNGVRLIS